MHSDEADTALLLYVGIPVVICVLLGLLAGYLYSRWARERARMLEMSRRARLHHKCRDHHCCGVHQSSHDAGRRRSSGFSSEDRMSDIPDEKDKNSDELSNSIDSEETCPMPIRNKS